MKEKNDTRVYLIGGGLSSFASAYYLINDAKVKPENIHILEQDNIIGGALDGSGDKKNGFLARGGRMTEEKMRCLWDLLSNIPSLTNPGQSVKDEIFDFNKKYVSNAQSRLLKEAEVIDVSSFGLSLKAQFYMTLLTLTPERFLKDKKISDWFYPEFFNTKFWKLWESMFAFQVWSSVAEMRRYFVRFMHRVYDLQKLGGIYRTKYNQYDSIILPFDKWLKDRGVVFEMKTRVTDIDFEINGSKKRAAALHCLEKGKTKIIDLKENDYVFLTNGSIVDASDTGTMTKPAKLKGVEDSGSWQLWTKVAAKDPSFGNPKAFCGNIDKQKWESFTVTMTDPLFLRHLAEKYDYIPGVSGLVTITDSNWLLSFVVPAQPHFSNQPADVQVFWGYGLYQDRPGNYINKTMQQCTGKEILFELFYHLKIIDKMRPVISSGKINSIPCMMPFIDSLFMPRKKGDRPKVVPHGSSNFAFLGQFADVDNDCVFTVEYSVRTAMVAVRSLFKTGKRVVPVYLGGRKIISIIKAAIAFNR